MPTPLPTKAPSPCVQTFDVTYSIRSAPCDVDWRGQVHALGDYSYLDYSALCQLYSQDEEFFYVNSGMSFSGAEADWTAFENVVIGPATYRADICDSSYSGEIELHLTNSADVQSAEFQGDMVNVNDFKSDLTAKFVANADDDGDYNEYDVDIEFNLPQDDDEGTHFDIDLDLNEVTDDEQWAIQCSTSLEVKYDDTEDFVLENMVLSGYVMDVCDLFNGLKEGTHFEVEVVVDNFSFDPFDDDTDWYTEPFCVTADSDGNGIDVVIEEAGCSFRRRLLPYFEGSSEVSRKDQNAVHNQGERRKLTDASSSVVRIFADEAGATKSSHTQNESVFSALMVCSPILLMIGLAIKYLTKKP